MQRQRACMRIVIGTQLVVMALVIVILGLTMGQAVSLPALYGAALGILSTALIKRNADRALRAAEDSPRYAFVAMYSGLVLRYAIVVLGLLIGFRVLQLAPISLIGGFILMIIVQVIALLWAGPGAVTNGID